MNEQPTTCPKCRNTEIFVELVWEQRRYHIDGFGETLYASDPIEDTEFLVEKSCEHCGAIMEKNEIKPPSASDDGFWNFWKDLPHYWEELPTYTDFSKNDKYLRIVKELVANRNATFENILEEYDVAPVDARIMINWLFVQLCGHSLPAIIKMAHGYESDVKEPEGEKQ